LGAIVHIALAGRPPVVGDGMARVTRQHAEAAVAPIPDWGPEVQRSHSVGAGQSQKALAKAPDQRFATATDFIALWKRLATRPNRVLCMASPCFSQTVWAGA